MEVDAIDATAIQCWTSVQELEDENRRLKHLVAELTLDNRILKDVNSKNW